MASFSFAEKLAKIFIYSKIKKEVISVPLEIVRNDLTKMAVDAIVSPANSSLTATGGLNGEIHRLAGEKLSLECKTLCGCNTGEAKITKGYNLPSQYVIHTVGPVYKNGSEEEAEALANCYKNALELAKEYKCETLAFPLISSGKFGYPKDKALRIAVDTIGGFLMENDMTVYLVVYDKKAFSLSSKLFADIKEYIDDNYIDLHTEFSRRRYAPAAASFRASTPSYEGESCSVISDLEKEISEIDESFSQMLLRKIDEKGIKDSVCYKKANIDRKLFSKIRSNVNYKPSKITVLAFAIALELSLSETEEMLKKAGFALSKSNKADIIVEYFIKNSNYNIFEINEALFAFDQNLLGG